MYEVKTSFDENCHIECLNIKILFINRYINIIINFNFNNRYIFTILL
jgi:hypothetical protein